MLKLLLSSYFIIITPLIPIYYSLSFVQEIVKGFQLNPQLTSYSVTIILTFIYIIFQYIILKIVSKLF